MEALRASLCNSLHMSTKSTTLHKTHFPKSMLLNLQSTDSLPNSSYRTFRDKVSKFKAFTSTVSTDPEVETGTEGEKFDWFSQWYPVMPVCDLDKRVPHAKTVMGLDVALWWDRNDSVWKVFDDNCPHRLAPLSEGRIDQWGRLQCVYHGWCFSGSGDCKFIPQAPPDGPPEHKLMDVGPRNWQKACFLPAKSDAQVVAFRKRLKKFSDGQISWGNKYPKTLPPSPPKEQLMDWYWSHVVNCSSCRGAYMGLNALEVVLQLVSIVSLGIVAATKHGVLSATARTALVSMAVLCIAASKWLSNVIYKNFNFHDYNHALR